MKGTSKTSNSKSGIKNHSAGKQEQNKTSGIRDKIKSSTAWKKFSSLSSTTKGAIAGALIFLVIGSISTAANQGANLKIGSNEQQQQKISVCDGKKVTKDCQGEDGIEYVTYIYHEPVKEVTETINHPAEPAKTHVVHHEAVYGTRTVQECIESNIGNKGGCAKSRCRDGTYSGSTGRGTCSHHGGVAASGPFYITREERYVITPAWDETVVDEPAKEAWVETKVITPAKDGYVEKEEKSQK